MADVTLRLTSDNHLAATHGSLWREPRTKKSKPVRSPVNLREGRANQKKIKGLSPGVYVYRFVIAEHYGIGIQLDAVETGDRDEYDSSLGSQRNFHFRVGR